MQRPPLKKMPRPDFADRLRRALWSAVWMLLFRPSPILLHSWRCLLLRLFGADIRGRALPYPSARIWAPWNLTMMDGSCLGSGSECYNVARVTLHPHSIVSQRAYLCTASHDLVEPGFALTAAPIAIGPYAWVAASAFVGPGVELGEYAMVAACAVAIRDVPAGQIVGGNPAKAIGTRVNHHAGQG
jgi:putative colanic acid biosynthesis acetyltransferase WcaF